MIAKLLIVIGFILAIAFIALNNRKNSSEGGYGESPRGRKKGQQGNSGNRELEQAAEALKKAAESMEKIHMEQQIEKIGARYSSGSQPQSTPGGGKLNRPL